MRTYSTLLTVEHLSSVSVMTRHSILPLDLTECHVIHAGYEDRHSSAVGEHN